MTLIIKQIETNFKIAIVKTFNIEINPSISKTTNSLFGDYQSTVALSLAKHILHLGELLDKVEKDLSPNHLCQYLFELSQKFNQFFESCPVLKSEEPFRTSLLILANLL